MAMKDMAKRHSIVVCMGSSCFSRGNSANLDAIKQYLTEKQSNAAIELKGSRCEGECMHGPNIRVNGKLYSSVTPQDIAMILDQELDDEVE